MIRHLSLCLLFLAAANAASAQDVSVYSSGGDLYITSYYNGARVTVYGDNGVLEITGLNGTTINGEASDEAPYPADDIIVNLAGTNNVPAELHLYHLYFTEDDIVANVGGDFYMYMAGTGSRSHSDLVVNSRTSWMYSVWTGRDLRLQGTRGMAHEIAESWINRNLELTGSNYRDTLEIANVWVNGQARLKSGRGNDEIWIDGLEGYGQPTPLLEVILGDHQDAVHLANCATTSEFFSGGSGSDTAYVGSGNLFTINSSNSSSISVK